MPLNPLNPLKPSNPLGAGGAQLPNGPFNPRGGGGALGLPTPNRDSYSPGWHQLPNFSRGGSPLPPAPPSGGGQMFAQGAAAAGGAAAGPAPANQQFGGLGMFGVTIPTVPAQSTGGFVGGGGQAATADFTPWTPPPEDTGSTLGIGGDQTPIDGAVPSQGPTPPGGTPEQPPTTFTNDTGIQNFPGFPMDAISQAANGDPLVAANIQEEFLKLAQAFGQGTDAVVQKAIDNLKQFGIHEGILGEFVTALGGPLGTTGIVGSPDFGGSPVVSPFNFPAIGGMIPSHFQGQSMSEGEARTAILQDLALQRNQDLLRRGQQQEFLLSEKGRLDSDPLAVALQGSIMDRLENPDSIDEATKASIFGQFADQAASQEASLMDRLASRLGSRGVEGSGLGAGLGARIAADRDRSVLDARRQVEIQQALQNQQDRAAAQSSANAFFQGREALLGSLAGNIASIGIGGGVQQTLGQEIPDLPSQIALANADLGPSSNFLDSPFASALAGGIGTMLGGPAGGALFGAGTKAAASSTGPKV